MQLQAEPEFAGKFVRCPGCNTKLQIPETVSSGTSLQGLVSPKGTGAPDGGGYEEAATGAADGSVPYERSQFERGGWEEKDPTNPNGLLCFSIGLAATLLLGGILTPFNPPASVDHGSYNGLQWIASLFFKHWEVSFANFFMFAWAMTILFFKGQKLRHQRQALLLNVLPWELGSEINAENVGVFIDHLYKLPVRLRDSMMVNRIRKALELFEVKQNNDSVSHMLESQSDIDSMRIGGSYTLIKAFFWAIPILGFIGTVIGLSHAIGGMQFSNMEDIDAIMKSLGAVTGGLGTAFDATLLGLLLAMVLNFPLNTMSKDEDDCLNEVDAFCNEVLLPRLNDGGGLAGGDPAGMMNMLVTALTQVQRDFLGELTSVTTHIKEQSRQLEERAAAHEKKISEEFVNSMNRMRQELITSVSESVRATNDYTRSLAEGLSQHAGKIEEKASSEYATMMAKIRQDLTGNLSESAQSTAEYVKAMTNAINGLNTVLAELGQKQIIVQQVKKGWFGR
jgi:biopolymer transport protein ExbB/TolQ